MGSLLKRLSGIFLRPELVFLSLAVPFGILSAIMVPQLSVADENSHYLKTYNLASGQLGNRGCSYPEAVVEKFVAVESGNYGSILGGKADLGNAVSSTCGPAKTYTPIMHMPQATGMLAAKIVHLPPGLMVLFGRLANLAFFVIAMYYIVKKVRLGKWVFVTIGLLPLSIHSAASLSADVVNNIIVLGFAAFVFNLFLQASMISKKQLILLLALCGLLALTKPGNLVLLFPLLFLPARLFAKNSIEKLPFNVRKWAMVALCGVVGLIFISGWQMIYGAPIAGPVHQNALTNNPLYFLTILYNTYINPVIGYGGLVIGGLVEGFASFRYHLPFLITLLCLVTLVISFLYADETKDAKKMTPSFAIGSLGAISLLILAVTYAMYTYWATQPDRFGPTAIYADGVQGRYFTAALIFLLPASVWLRQYVHVATKSPRVFGVFIFSAAAFWLLFYVMETCRFVS